MTHVRFLALALGASLLAFGCGSAEGEGAAAATPPAKVAPPVLSAKALTAGTAARTIEPFLAELKAAGVEYYAVGVGRCWEGDGVCLQIEAQTGTDEARVRELAARSFEASGFEGPVEVRLTDDNPRGPQRGQ